MARPPASETLPAGVGGTSGPAPPGVPVPRRRPSRHGHLGARPAAAALFLLPALLILGALVIYPIIATVVASFQGPTGGRFVGLDNYKELFTNRRTLTAIRNNVVWVAVVPATVTALGLVFAVLSERITFQRAFKAVIFMPMAISLLAGGVIWRVVYEQSPDRGVLNAGIDAARSVFRPPGHYAGATPSAGMRVEGKGMALEAPVTAGRVYQLGLVGLPPEQVPEDAEQAELPVTRPGRAEVAGVVFRDFRPGGGGQRGVVDQGELGLPGAKVELRGPDGSVEKSAVTDEDGSFRIEDVADGTFTLGLAPSNFRPPFEGIQWLGPTLITPAIIVAYIWVWAGFAMMVLAAGLAALPREVLEAARVDGAGEWQTFRRITVPLLAPEMGVVFITMVIYVLKVFDIVLVIAPEAVQDNANVIALEMWQTAFGARDQGLGSAVAVFLFLLVLPVMVFNVKRFRAERG
ncbi:MAG: ABC transporter permease subunit [Actinomycetota bacterium]|nr:ABC transporter permease subunit [Actinomycetota bacterium]